MGAAGSILDDEKSPPKNNIKQPSSLTPIQKIDGSSDYPCFSVSLAFWPGEHVNLPDPFLLRISYESLDFVRMSDQIPLVQFPFQNIICWGSSPQNFQFKVFDLEKSEIEKRDSGILISLRTNQGKKIEDATMSTVQKLMVDINSRAISKQEFAILLNSILDENDQLKEEWSTIIDQFTSSGRLFLAKQGMELLVRIGSQAPFEKFELACLIYERMINKNSIQLLINTFEDPQERENLIHRLKLNKDKKVVTTECMILPEKSMPAKAMQVG